MLLAGHLSAARCAGTVRVCLYLRPAHMLSNDEQAHVQQALPELGPRSVMHRLKGCSREAGKLEVDA
jgi:hypothetical protein